MNKSKGFSAFVCQASDKRLTRAAPSPNITNLHKICIFSAGWVKSNYRDLISFSPSFSETTTLLYIPFITFYGSVKSDYTFSLCFSPRV